MTTYTITFHSHDGYHVSAKTIATPRALDRLVKRFTSEASETELRAYVSREDRRIAVVDRKGWRYL